MMTDGDAMTTTLQSVYKLCNDGEGQCDIHDVTEHP